MTHSKAKAVVFAQSGSTRSQLEARPSHSVSFLGNRSSLLAYHIQLYSKQNHSFLVNDLS
jgi:hypothetical protein